MARIVFGSYMVRYPLGGMMSWVIQHLRGFVEAGHEVWFVEKSGYENSCFDPELGIMSDDCSYGTRAVDTLLRTIDLEDRWCYVDADGNYRGRSREKIESVFASADVFVDMGTHGSWQAESEKTACRVMIDGEPGFTQMKWILGQEMGKRPPDYDHYFTNGRLLCDPDDDLYQASERLGIRWRPFTFPVATSLFDPCAVDRNAPFTTVMNWQSYEPLHFHDREFGHKDLEFQAFLDLPTLAGLPLEVAVAPSGGEDDRLKEHGWRVRSGHEVTRDFASFREYIRSSRGEFGVCKNGFVATHSGWFSDRSAAYLASGRPVVLQDTGFSEYLPVGEGLFAVKNVHEARDALNEIDHDWDRHSRAARRIACEHLGAKVILADLLNEIGVS